MERNKLTSGLSSVGIGIVIAVLVVVGVVGYQMFNTAPEDAMTTSETMMEDDSMVEDDAMMEEDDSMMEDDAMMEETRVIEVEGGSFYFEPNEITVKKGETVKIVLNSVDMMHDFVIDELDVSTPIIQGGDTGEVEFTATEAGTFEFYCSVGNHRAQGMVGTLIVEE